MKIEKADKKFDSDDNLLKTEVVTIESKQEFREEGKISRIWNVHENKEQHRIIENRVVEDEDHWSNLDQKFTQVEPIWRASHKTFREGVSIEVIHCVVSVYYEQPNTVNNAEDGNNDVTT